MINVTDLAAEKLKGLIQEEGHENASLRIMAVPQGSGLQYMMTLETDQKEDDIVVSKEGIRVVVDSDSAPLLEGSEIDFVEGLMRSGFTINNPNFVGGGCGSGSCGCGGDSGGGGDSSGGGGCGGGGGGGCGCGGGGGGGGCGCGGGGGGGCGNHN